MIIISNMAQKWLNHEWMQTWDNVEPFDEKRFKFFAPMGEFLLRLNDFLIQING